MGVLVSTIGLSPAVVTEIVDELGKRNISIREVILLPTKRAMLSYHMLLLDFKYGPYKNKIRLEKEDLPFNDIRNKGDCRTFRAVMRRALRKAAKKAGDPQRVYVNLAGGRKTMPIDALLISMAAGIENVYHIIAEEVPGVENVLKALSDKAKREIDDCIKSKRKPSDKVLEKIVNLCHPKGLTIHLVKIPIPSLNEEERKRLIKELL